MGKWKALRKASGTGWKELERESGTGWKALLWLLEDFTTFTEVDVAADRIQKTVNHIDHAAHYNEVTYLYKDYGAGHFGDFTHKIKVLCDVAPTSSLGVIWMLANDLGAKYPLYAANKTFICMYLYRASSGTRYIVLYEARAGYQCTDSYLSMVLDTWYYIKIVKSGTSLTAYIYSDSNYSILIDTLVITLQADYTFKYLYGCNTQKHASKSTIMVTDIENFNIGE